ncbi:GNAT family N-acetyltransferase [Halalkalibacter hemicellulosilyticus]|uniref:Ribosomal-protein-alanine acetyltransferase n=1 Tax=Halalkalibacter hemicellulosilyticusJCM 9152 TaxID=1236971 RepID=W4QHJ5_9BACI|nr:GNAT family protein [Halalkalibacter hemicellulosilyticus]GAE31128.1 ribosomal-protein-alanine acetyltransferase [Halalkalibacter hemicellulosilyticusJCM 9152]
MILKQRDVADCHHLYELLVDPAVFPFVREKAHTYDEYVFLTKKTIEAEECGELISRTIVDEWGSPIGTINLYDVHEQSGFLGTWIGSPYFGLGYNQRAKEAFFNELFFSCDIQTVYMRIRKHNERSYHAALKLPYCTLANELRPDIFEALNQKGDYNLFQIEKDLYHLHLMRTSPTIERKEA